jgi:hypothetical protein
MINIGNGQYVFNSSCGCATREIHEDTVKHAKDAVGKEAMRPELFEQPLAVAAAVYEGLLVIDQNGLLQKGTL